MIKLYNFIFDLYIDENNEAFYSSSNDSKVKIQVSSIGSSQNKANRTSRGHDSKEILVKDDSFNNDLVEALFKHDNIKIPNTVVNKNIKVENKSRDKNILSSNKSRKKLSNKYEGSHALFQSSLNKDIKNTRKTQIQSPLARVNFEFAKTKTQIQFELKDKTRPILSPNNSSYHSNFDKKRTKLRNKKVKERHQNGK